jgi:hypothetical protein
MGRLIILALMFVSISVATAGGDEPESSWTSDWWSNVYEQRIEKEQYEQYQQKTLTRCELKIKWYTDKVAEQPDSDYYKYKLESWTKRCAEDKK